ncbi:MAG: Cell wall surface anchor family protein, putative, partial [Bacteroidetes bacterium 38_7]
LDGYDWGTVPDATDQWVNETGDTMTGNLTVDATASIRTRLIGSLGTELGIGAGEMFSQMDTNITGETLWLGGESGVKIVSSPDNLATGWAGRYEATLVDTSGNSSFPGNLSIASSLYVSGNERFNTSGALIPHTVSSTTKFTNLNADLLDGYDWGTVPDATDQWVNETGDTMTGSLIFSGVTNDITTVSNQHLALMPDGTGNVGIGTTAPDSKLHVAGDTNLGGTRVYETVTKTESWVGSAPPRFYPLGQVWGSYGVVKMDISEQGCGLGASGSFYFPISYSGDVSGAPSKIYYRGDDGGAYPSPIINRLNFYIERITSASYYIAVEHSGGCADSAATLKVDITTSAGAQFSSSNTDPLQANYGAMSTRREVYEGFEYDLGLGTTTPSYALDVVSGDSIAARFDGRVIGSDGVNSNEFVTKSQLDGVAGNETITLTGSVTGSGTTSIATTLQDHISYDVIAGNGNGLKFWGGSDSYKIHMGNSVNHQYGPVTDYSIKTNMNSTAGRGWTWGVVDTAPIAALSNAGVMQIASNFYSLGKVGIGTTSPGADLEVGTTTEASNSIIRALSADAYTQGFEAYGNSQGSGYLYVGQSSAYGGGMFYNGDGTPASGTSTDHISIYRRTGGVDTEVLHWLHSSSTAFFEGNVDLQNNGLVDVNWAASDDGSGSGLDADLLDGLDSTDFMSATEDLWVNENGDTMSGTLNMGTNSINGIFSAQFSNSVTTSHTGDNQGRLIFDSSEGFQFYESAGLGNRTG